MWDKSKNGTEEPSDAVAVDLCTESWGRAERLTDRPPGDPWKSALKQKNPRSVRFANSISRSHPDGETRPRGYRETPAKQGVQASNREPNEIGASTPYDFDSKNLTAYGGLLPVATMLERLKFQELVEETVTVKRLTRPMPPYQFVLGMVLAC